MTGAEARGNAQPDFAALNPGLAGAPLLQQQQQADRDTCKDHPVREPCPCRIFRFGRTDGEVRPRSARGAHALPPGVTPDRRVLV